MRDVTVEMLIDLPRWICTELKVHHMKQYELAERMGVHKNTVSRWTRGVGTPTCDQMLRMMLIFGYRVSKD